MHKYKGAHRLSYFFLSRVDIMASNMKITQLTHDIDFYMFQKFFKFPTNTQNNATMGFG